MKSAKQLELIDHLLKMVSEDNSIIRLLNSDAPYNEEEERERAVLIIKINQLQEDLKTFLLRLRGKFVE